MREMPYIQKEDRERYRFILEAIEIQVPQTKGELNYFLSMCMLIYAKKHGFNYQNLSDTIAAASDAAEEFRRRYMNPYEDLKLEENGDLC